MEEENESKVGDVSEHSPLLRTTTSYSMRLHTASKHRHWKNVTVLGLTFTLTFTAYMALQNIQSSLNHQAGLGLASLATIYAAVILTSIFSPLIIRQVGVKWTIVFSTICYCIYSACNFSISYGVLIPASLLLGSAAAPLWVAQGTYLTTSAIQVADIVNDVPETIINRFNGVLFGFFQSSQIWGNLISSFILYDGFTKETKPINISNCGKCVCGSQPGSESKAPDEETVQILLACFVLCGMAAVLLALIFLDPLPAANSRIREGSGSLKSLVTSTFSLTTNYQLFLLIPIMMYSGVEQAFLFGDFTKSYVTCTQGIAYVGLVMIAFGASDAIGSVVIGQIEKFTGRIFLITCGGILQLGFMVLLYVWKPSGYQESSDVWQLFVVASAWGIGDAIWQTQISSMIGVIFASCQEPAFSNFRLWQAVGLCISFASSIPEVVCVWHKLIAISALLIVSLIFYYFCEYRIRRND